MKRFLMALLLFLLIPIVASGEDYNAETYRDVLSSYDLSFFDKTLDEDTRDALEELGLDDFSPDSIYSLKLTDFGKRLRSLAASAAKAPLEGAGAVLLFIVLSAFFRSLKEEGSMSELYATVTALILAVLLVAKISPAISLSAISIGVSSDFIYSFLPVFGAIVAASGGITVSFSSNAMLLLLSQGLAFLSAQLFMPLINCFLALGICASLRPQLGIGGLLESARKLLTAAMSFLAGSYVSVLSLKTAAASRMDALGLRSVRFVITSVVPVVGGALSEGLVSIQTYSSLIKSSVGVVGIIAVAFIFLPSLTGVLFWRLMLTACGAVGEMFGDGAVAGVLRAFSSALLVLEVLLIISALATVISIGILIAAGN